jgi:hypothetical protein
MRVILIALCACGTTVSNAPRSSPTAPATKPRIEARTPIDVIDALEQPLAESSWIVPGPAQLVLGGASLQADSGAPRLEVSVFEEQGRDVRVGVRLEHARFALWMPRSRLLAIVARDQRVQHRGAPIRLGGESKEVVLHRGALVQRLAREDTQTQIRYIGALEVEGWVPDEALTERAPAGRTKSVASGKKPLMLVQGAIIRAEPRWGGQQLAVMNHGFWVEEVKKLDDAWTEVRYEDSDLSVLGYVSRREPPGRTHRRKLPEATSVLAPNASVRDGTCLYVSGEAVGFIVGDRQALVDKGDRAGWSLLTIETPWGPIAFDVKGSVETALATCGG